MDSAHILPTTYQGVTFRSRLEARWAIAFDAWSIAWEYEPEGYELDDGTWYCPDFWLPQVQMWAEVKPNDDPRRVVVPPESLRRVVLLAVGTGRPVILLDGLPRVTNYWAVWPDPHPESPWPEGTQWAMEDVELFEGHQYHLDEHRFFACSGQTYPRHRDVYDHDIDHPAVVAARCARFDRGTFQ